ncbi:hypothetical protein N9A42_00505 [bacterium]|nr:hypothetical protein [bacterium]
MVKYLILFELLNNDFSHTVLDENIPPEEVERTVVQYAENMFPDAEHLYYYDDAGDYTVDIIVNDVCRTRLSYTS